MHARAGGWHRPQPREGIRINANSQCGPRNAASGHGARCPPRHRRAIHRRTARSVARVDSSVIGGFTARTGRASVFTFSVRLCGRELGARLEARPVLRGVDVVEDGGIVHGDFEPVGGMGADDGARTDVQRGLEKFVEEPRCE